MHVRGRHRLLAQRRRGEGRAGARRRRPRGVDDPATTTWRRLGFGAPTGIDVAGEVARPRPRPGRSRRGARSTSRTARSARASRSRRSSSRPAYAAMVNGGVAGPAARRRRRSGADETDRRPARPGRVDADCQRTAAADDGPRPRRGPVLPRPDRRSRATRSAARPARPRSGTREKKALEAQPLQLLVRRLHRPRGGHARPRRRGPDRGGDRRPSRARPAGDAGDVVRAVPAHRDRRDHHARTCCRRSRPSRSPSPRDGPVTRAPCDTRPSVSRRRPVRRPTPPDAPTLYRRRPPSASPAAGSCARSDRPIRGAAVDSRLVRPGSCSSPCPASAPTATASSPTRSSVARRPLLVTRGRSDEPGGARRRDDRARRRRAGGPRRGRGRLAPPVRPARRRRHRQHRQDVDEGGGRRGPRRRPADAPERGQPEQRDRAAADAPAPRPGARRGGARDGHVRRRRDRRPGRDGAADDRRRDRRPAASTCRASARSTRSSRPRASWSRRCRPTATRC